MEYTRTYDNVGNVSSELYYELSNGELVECENKDNLVEIATDCTTRRIYYTEK